MGLHRRLAMVSMCNMNDGKRSSATTPKEEMEMGDVELEFDTIGNGYRAWAGKEGQKEEQWRR